MNISEIINAWNSQADECNQWDDLGGDEQVEWTIEMLDYEYKIKTRLSDLEFRSLLNLWMSSDPWPCDGVSGESLLKLLDEESVKRGFDTWVDAYHNFIPNNKDGMNNG